MDRDQAVYLSLPSLSSSVFSCSDGGSAGICNNTKVPTSALLLAFSLAAYLPLLILFFTRLEELSQDV